ncbi:MAG: aliphatic sulfonate ABC transporter substrate-binding protein [Firmicutes bacterium]|nr:aliphatic sulfonate ABC transporter substrate-binding protein [Bacillota bacterium]
MKKIISMLLLPIFIILLVAGCSTVKTKDAGSGEQKKPEKIRIAWQPGITPLLEVAIQQGWFEEEFKKDGIQVEFEKFLSGPPMIEAFAGGRLDFGSVGDQPLIQARANNIDIKAIASQTVGYKVLGLVVPNGSEIKSPKDLRGKKVGVTVGSAAHQLLLLYLESNGLTANDIKLVNLQPPDIKTSLTAKQIDATVLWEPWISTIEIENIGHQISDASGLKLNTGVIIASNDFGKKYPDIVKRFLTVYKKSEQFIKENPNQAAQLIAKGNGMKPEIMTRVLSNFEYEVRLTDEVINSLGQTAKYLRETNVIRKDVTTQELVDTSYLKAAGLQ